MIDIKPERARTPLGTVRNTDYECDFGERSVTLIAIEFVSPIVRDEDVFETVRIIVANGHALTVFKVKGCSRIV